MLSIENNILKKCDNSIIGEVIIPDSINEISSYAFKNCKDITSVTIPISVKKIGHSIFKGCTKLKSVYIYGNVEELGFSCFEDCVNLEEVILPNTLKRIRHDVFKGCINLTNIHIPDSVDTIYSSCFEDCRSLQQIDLPSSLEYIGEKAFMGVESIIEISIPRSVKFILESAFENCTSLGVVKILSEHIEISPTAFRNCIAITKLYLKNFNECLVLSSFGDCNLLNSIIPLDKAYNAIIKQATPKFKIQKSLSEELKFMSMYYHHLGMNITQMKWEKSLRNKKSFKEPIDTNWATYKHKAQDMNYILSMDWNNSEGIGLVLGHNQYRALDIDGVNSFFLDHFYGENGLDNFINEFLELLKLPKNYPWVVYSGSGNGFHIIFKSEDFGDDIDSIAFEPNDKYGEFNYRLFTRIELRWCDHLVLPPSIHASGNKYKFREEGLPIEMPSSIHLTDIDNLINNYCGELSVQSYTTKNGDKLEFAELSKIVTRHDSYLSHHEYTKISINWLCHSNLDESKVSLALKYILGEGVTSDYDKAHNILENCYSKNAIFNLLTLYSLGFYLCEYDRFENLLAQLDDSNFSRESIELIKENSYKYIDTRKKILFFDTETTGIPNSFHAPITDILNWPRLVQIAWIITDEDGNELKKRKHLIEPNGFLIPEDATAVHGITTEQALQEGIPLQSALVEFMSDLNCSELIVGHNIDYDINIVGAELYRLNMEYNDLVKKNKICTMKKSVDYCAIPNPNAYYGGYKWPKLEELYRKLFNCDILGAHDALIDIQAAKKCYFELKKKGIL